MIANVLEYICSVNPGEMEKGDGNKLYKGAAHEVDDPQNFPSPSSVINESKSKTGVFIPQEHTKAFDEAYRAAMEKCFGMDPKKGELDDFLETGLSNGRKLRLQVMMLPPGLYFKIHAHPNIEFELTLSGCLEEFRFLFRVPAEELKGNSPSGPNITQQHVFEHCKVSAGECMINAIGSVHQSFTGKDKHCALLVLWSGCHANTRPENVSCSDDRLQPSSGW